MKGRKKEGHNFASSLSEKYTNSEKKEEEVAAIVSPR